LIQHIIEDRYVTVFISDDGEVELNIVDFVDVSNPLLMGTKFVSRKTDNVDVTGIKLILESSNETKLSGADRGYTSSKFHITMSLLKLKLTKVSGVREKDGPLVTDEVVELNITLSSLGLEVCARITRIKNGIKRLFFML
jgi:hypothetical protein